MKLKKRWDAFKSDMINTPAISHTVNMVYFDKSMITNKKGATFKKLLPISLPFNISDSSNSFYRKTIDKNNTPQKSVKKFLLFKKNSLG